VASDPRPLAIVTGASTGIGYELAHLCAENGFDLLIAADEPEIGRAAAELTTLGGAVEAVQADLATTDGVDRLLSGLKGRPVAALLANAGRGLGRAFVDQDWDAIRRVIDTNVTGTTYLIHQIARAMAERGEGRVLIVGSIAGFMPGAYQSVYNATKSYGDSFATALREELKPTGVTVTCLMPGPTDTEFFARGDLEDTRFGQMQKDDPAKVAKTGFDAMMKGTGDVVHGWHNKLQSALAEITPASLAAKVHTRLAGPGTGEPER
jgi:uncharacterized protein